MTTIEKKIQKKVDEINKLIALANLPEDADVENSYDGKVMVVDTSSTWEEPAIYEPIVFRNGVLYIEYFEPYSNRTKKEKILKRDLEYDGYGTLLDIAKMYKKALKKAEVRFQKGGRVGNDITNELQNFNINNLDYFETIQYNQFYPNLGKVGALQVLINNVEGDYSQLSEELSELAEKQMSIKDWNEATRQMMFERDGYADGGNVKPFEYKENNSTIMINGTKEDVKKMYLDYKNNFLSVSRFAEYYNISETQANSIINQGRKYAKEDGYYASGGVTENYVSRKELNTITIKKGNQKLTYKISDVLNGAYKLESGAKLEDIAFYVPKRNIVKVQLKTGKDFKPANGYWIKDGAKPIHVTKFDDGGKITGSNPYQNSNLIRERYELLNDMYYSEYSDVDYTDILKVGDVIYGDDIQGFARIVKEVNDPIKGDYFILQDRFNEKFAFYIVQLVRDLHSKEIYLQNVSVSEKDFLYSEDLIELNSKIDFLKGRIRLYEKNPNDASNYHGINYQSYISSKIDLKKLEEDFRLMLKDERRKFADGGQIKVGDLLKKRGRSISVKVVDVGNDWRSGYDTITIYNDVTNTTTTLVDWSDYEKVEYSKMATGGKVSFKEKARAIAKNFEGKRVEPKYQKEYGKVYDKAEAKEVGNKIAGSQKAKYDAKLEKGSEVKKGKGNHKMKATTDLARKIRKEGEKWTDAIKRASEQLK